MAKIRRGLPPPPPREGQGRTFALFLRRTLAPYFGTSRPSRKVIDGAFGKLQSKARTASKPYQLDIIGDMSKGVFSHVPEGSEHKDYAWDKHIELEKEIRKQREHFQTELKKGLQGELSTRRVGISAGVETTRQPATNNRTGNREEPML